MSEPIHLQLLQIELINYTNIRAHELVRTEPLTTLILSRSNMNMLIGPDTDPIGHEWQIDEGLWNRLPLPPGVAPTFETCNISRYYELEVRVGLSAGPLGRMKVCVSGTALSKVIQIDKRVFAAPSHCHTLTAGREGVFRHSSTTSSSRSYDCQPETEE